MRLVKARVKGFQSFCDTGDVEFSDGINLVIGQNNAGKSAFMRALLPGVPDDRHRTPSKWETFRLHPPEIRLSIDVSGAELQDWILRSGIPHFIPITNGNLKDNDVLQNEFFNYDSIVFNVVQ